MPSAIRKAYVAPFNSWKNRISTLRFVQDIPLSPQHRNYQLVEQISASLQHFQSTPTVICWGLKDFVFDKHFLARWKLKMPHATVNEFPDCGHYILEDEKDDVIKNIEDFIGM